MTSNQVAYWSMLEQARTNREHEKLEDYRNRELRRSNMAQEALKGDIQEAQKKRWDVQNTSDIWARVNDSVDIIWSNSNDSAGNIIKLAGLGL